MPWPRKTLTELRTQAAQAIQSSLQGTNAGLRFQVLTAIANAIAGLAYDMFAYLAWIARQAVPYTAEGPYLEAWAALKKVFREAPHQASGVVSFQGTVGKLVPSGTAMTRADGVAFTSTADATVAATGIVQVSVKANADPEGLLGAFGNTAVGVQMSLSAPIDGISGTGSVSTAIAGGTDLEKDDSLRARMLVAYQTRPEGGAEGDYLEWADIAGITRVWVKRNGFGAGTVVIYIMLDVTEAAHNGFPQGTNGVSQYEDRDTPATGDQLLVADALWNLQPVTALVYAVSPIDQPQDFTITGLSAAGSVVQANVIAAMATAINQQADPRGTTIDLSPIEAAIAAVPGTQGFVITTPTANITTPVGYLLTLGTVTFA